MKSIDLKVKKLFKDVENIKTNLRIAKKISNQPDSVATLFQDII